MSRSCGTGGSPIEMFARNAAGRVIGVTCETISAVYVVHMLSRPYAEADLERK